MRPARVRSLPSWFFAAKGGAGVPGAKRAEPREMAKRDRSMVAKAYHGRKKAGVRRGKPGDTGL